MFTNLKIYNYYIIQKLNFHIEKTLSNILKKNYLLTSENN